MEGAALTKPRLESILAQLEAHRKFGVHQQAVAWIRDPLIFESDIPDLNQVLRDHQLSLQVAESRVLLMSSSPQMSAQDIYESLALQASEI
jgi:hypothetical protein